MRRVRSKEGIIWIIVGGIICFLSDRIGVGAFREPGPGFVPFASGLSLLVIGGIMTFSKTFSETASEVGHREDRPFLRLPKFSLVHTVLALVGYGLVLDLLGYLISTFLLMFALFYDRASNRFLPSVWASLLTVMSTYLIFETWLHVQLPRGILPWW
jgi:putative tricarboxylic transport membrane protein